MKRTIKVLLIIGLILFEFSILGGNIYYDREISELKTLLVDSDQKMELMNSVTIKKNDSTARIKVEIEFLMVELDSCKNKYKNHVQK